MERVPPRPRLVLLGALWRAVCLPPEDGATSTTPTLCCACHGSTFDGDGLATSGPAAPQRLTHWRVVVEGGRVQVRVGERVEANVRATE
jgi:Rieske Fe-S protein